MEADVPGKVRAAGEGPAPGEALTRTRSWAVALLLTGFIAVTVDVLLSGPLTRLDWAVHLFVEEYARGVWWLASDVSAYAGGNQYLLVAALGVLCLGIAARYRTLRPVVIVFGVCVVLAIVIPGLKELTGRTPPRFGYDEVFTDETEYPSGHALNGIVLWGLLLELARSASRRVERMVPPWLRNTVLVVTAAAGGLGMVGMDYHWLSDVFAGWLLGAAMFVTLLGREPLRPIRDRRDADRTPRLPTGKAGVNAARMPPPALRPGAAKSPGRRRASRSPDRSSGR